ncbi:MAG TPA: hypothetical protein VNA20_17535 [Frankiaceae bacterium]|nr:hypothetical protein [Frankiaceae bacterium]
MTLHFAVDPWDPGYAATAETGLAAELDASAAPTDLDVEVPVDDWRPIDPDPAQTARCVLFVDGVRRIEARVWLMDGTGTAEPGIAASYAAGVVVCDGTARVSTVRHERGVFAAVASLAAIRTPLGERFDPWIADDGSLDTLSVAMQNRMRAVEIDTAIQARNGSPDDLLVVDGPLRGRESLPRTIGYIKTHQKSYLGDEQQRTVAALGPGQRTPVFKLGSTWSRYTWYVRLPGRITHTWAGIVRCECSIGLAPAAAVELADVSAATVPRFASSAHKEPRAPQNLYPIAGLERALRHRLGDRTLIHRELLRAAHATAPLASA